MKTVSLTEAKRNLDTLVERVHARDEEVAITRHGHPAAVLVSAAHESWKETIAIRDDASFMEEIRSGLAALKAGRTELYTLEELLR